LFPLFSEVITLWPDYCIRLNRASIDAEVSFETEDRMIRVGLVGYGYWGPNLGRNFAESEGTQVVVVGDTKESRLLAASRRHPGIRTTTDALDLIRDPNVDAVAIATPVNSHFDLAWNALSEGKHVLVEKPITSTAEEALRLIDLASRKNLVLMVDHTFIYTGAVRRIRDLLRSGEFGELYYYDSVRVNLGLFQNDVNVLWDLAVHDISIMNYVLPQQPVGLGDGRQSCSGRQRRYRIYDVSLQGQPDCPLPCKLAGSRESAPDPDRRQPQDDRL